MDSDRVASVSRILCRAIVRGKGSAKVSLYRHLAPLTIAAISRVLPVQSRANVNNAMVCAFTNVRVGVEKPRLSFKRGEVAFFPMNAVICFFTKDVKSERPLNPIGRVEDGIELFDSIRPGDVIELQLEVE